MKHTFNFSCKRVFVLIKKTKRKQGKYSDIAISLQSLFIAKSLILLFALIFKIWTIHLIQALSPIFYLKLKTQIKATHFCGPFTVVITEESRRYLSADFHSIIFDKEMKIAHCCQSNHVCKYWHMLLYIRLVLHFAWKKLFPNFTHKTVIMVKCRRRTYTMHACNSYRSQAKCFMHIQIAE